MTEINFTLLMSQFLRSLASELENNKTMACRLEEPFQTVLAESLSGEGIILTSRAGTSKSKPKKYPVPEGLDPYKIFCEQGIPGLYDSLQNLELEELKGVLAHFTTMPRDEFIRKRKRENLMELIVQGIQSAASQGEVVGQ